MNSNGRRLLFWSPRCLGILFALFLALFALDAFSEGVGVLRTIGAFLLHLIPALVVIIGIVVAWHREWLGAALFFALAAFYVATTFGRFPLVTYVAISGPLIAIGVLFLVNWMYRAELRAR